MRSSIILLLTVAAVSFTLTGCATPPAQATPQPTATATAVRLTPQPTGTPAPLRPTPQPAGTATASLVTVSDIAKNPETFRDQHVRMQGYGVIAATVPLCPGYVGLDRRTMFVDAARSQIVARVTWTPPANVRIYDPDHLRVFEGYIRIFSGEIGCPGAAKTEMVPYFEILGAE